MMTWMKALLGDVGGALTLKGYGFVQGGSNTANLSLSYGTVVSGSAPVAGDLVVWFAWAYDTGGSPVANLAGSGWSQNSNFVGTFIAAAIFAKVLVAGDISSPPVGISAPTNGSIGFWAAFSVAGAIAGVTVSSIGAQVTGVAPSNQTVDASAVVAPNVAITMGSGGGDDGSPTLSISGAAADIDYIGPSNSWGSSTFDTRFMLSALVGGTSVTFSKSDDGNNNHLGSGFVTVTF